MFNKKLLTKIVSIFTLTILTYPFLLSSDVYAQNASLYFSPASTTTSVGQSFSVRVMLDTSDEETLGVTADFTYPSNLLQVSSIDSSSSVLPNSSEEDYSQAGTVYISRYTIDAYSGTGEIVTVNFTALAAGSATLSFTSDAAVASSGGDEDILSTTDEATITIGESTDATNGKGALSTDQSVEKSTFNIVLAVELGLIGILIVLVIYQLKDKLFNKSS